LGLPDLTIVSGRGQAQARAARCASRTAPLAVVAKTRPAPDVAVATGVLGDVRGRACLIVDDMASTGGTLAGAAHALLAAGAREVNALFVHAVMAPGALERIRAASIGRIVTTDSVPASPTRTFRSCQSRRCSPARCSVSPRGPRADQRNQHRLLAVRGTSARDAAEQQRAGSPRPCEAIGITSQRWLVPRRRSW
jgi:hypothetical protein